MRDDDVGVKWNLTRAPRNIHPASPAGSRWFHLRASDSGIRAAGMSIGPTTRAAGIEDQEIAMNSIHRLGVGIAALVTVATVAGALFIQGYSTAQQAAVQASSQSAGVSAPPSATLGPEIVYVNPVPSPQVVNVTQTQPPAGPPPVIHVVVPSVGGDDGGADN
jgi:hypothetical protein